MLCVVMKLSHLPVQASYTNPVTEEKLIFGGSGLHVRNRIITCAHHARQSVFDHRTNQTLLLTELQYTKDVSAICTSNEKEKPRLTAEGF